MHFLSNGDFIFPFTWPFYEVQQFFVWSYQSGAANPSGLIRMPSKLVDLLSFKLFGNLITEYFYIVSLLVIVFASFFCFAKKFLGVNNIYARLIGALFFTLNPIFLGNLAKIGLVFAVAMLPLCLVVVKEGFRQGKPRYFLLWIVLLNISFVHPFTFAINLFASGSYFIYQTLRHKNFVINNIPSFVVVGGLALLLNAYFILPIVDIGTVSKSVLSSNVASVPVDYTALVAVANTGNILTGLSLSKDVLKDFDFYNTAYKNFYFLGVFVFYTILLGLYLNFGWKMDRSDRRWAVVFITAFLVLILLATVTVLHLATLIQLLINLPGGWAFRSPLKWQLYIPLALFSVLTLLIQHVRGKRESLLIYLGIVITFFLMNGFLFTEVYGKLLTPRKLVSFGSLQSMNLNHVNMLQVGSDECLSFEQQNPKVLAELNQVLISKNIQLKQINIDDVNTVDLASYDYVLGCNGNMKLILNHAYNFKLVDSYARNSFQLYNNSDARPYVFGSPHVFEVASSPMLSDKYSFATHVLGEDFNFTEKPPIPTLPTIGLQDTFEDLSLNSIKDNAITVTSFPTHSGPQDLYIKKGSQPLYYLVSGASVALSPQLKQGYQLLQDKIGVNLAKNNNLTATYSDTSYRYENLIPNPSLEQGLWQKKVSDCYNYDNQPGINMQLDKRNHTDGQNSLLLEASRHIACTGPGNIPVKPGQHYLLSFDYRSIGGQHAGYYTSFDNRNGAPVGNQLSSNGGWSRLTRDIVAPGGAHQLQILVYAHPDDLGLTTGAAGYDNFHLEAVPDIQNHFYLVSNITQKSTTVPKISFQITNPTKTIVYIQSAVTPFYLLTSETYNKQWRLESKTNQLESWSPFAKVNAVDEKHHLNINGSMNGWYLDPFDFCKQSGASCKQNNDGTYDIAMQIEFTPQRWFYVGSIVSGLTLLGFIGYLGFAWYRGKHKKENPSR